MVVNYDPSIINREEFDVNAQETLRVRRQQADERTTEMVNAIVARIGDQAALPLQAVVRTCDSMMRAMLFAQGRTTPKTYSDIQHAIAEAIATVVHLGVDAALGGREVSKRELEREILAVRGMIEERIDNTFSALREAQAKERP